VLFQERFVLIALIVLHPKHSGHQKQQKILIFGGVMVAVYLYNLNQKSTNVTYPINNACVAYESNDTALLKPLLNAITKTIPVSLTMVSAYCTSFWVTKKFTNLCAMKEVESEEIKTCAAEIMKEWIRVQEPLQQKAKKKSFKILEQKEVEPLRTK
jgi:hypothetical protein